MKSAKSNNDEIGSLDNDTSSAQDAYENYAKRYCQSIAVCQSVESICSMMRGVEAAEEHSIDKDDHLQHSLENIERPCNFVQKSPNSKQQLRSEQCSGGMGELSLDHPDVEDDEEVKSRNKEGTLPLFKGKQNHLLIDTAEEEQQFFLPSFLDTCETGKKDMDIVCRLRT